MGTEVKRVRFSWNSLVRIFRAIPVLMKSKVKFIFAYSWLVTVYLLIVGEGLPPIRPSVLTILSSIFITASVYIYNDIIDVEMDKENEEKKFRPIASGLINKSDAKIVVYLLGLVGLTLAWFVNIYCFSLILVFYIIFYSYSYPPIRLKKRFLTKDLTLFSSAPLLCLISNYAISNDFSILAFSSAFAMALYGFTIGPITNESSDIEEDKKYGVKSISTMLSWETKVRIMILGILLQMILVPFILFRFGSNLLLPVFSVVLLLLLLQSSYPLVTEYNMKHYNRAHKFTVLYVFMSPITFILLSFDISLFS